MSRGSRRGLPTALSTAQIRIEEWRTNRDSRRIPEELWSTAVELASEHGVHRTSRALQLNYDTLRRRVESRGAMRERSAPVFVDLVAGGGGVAAAKGVAEMIDAEGVP